MSLREELAEQEAASWAAFEPRLRTGDSLAFEWSQAEVAGHLAFWMERCAWMLEASAAGPVEDGEFEVGTSSSTGAATRSTTSSRST